jgi:hypothetical protein
MPSLLVTARNQFDRFCHFHSQITQHRRDAFRHVQPDPSVRLTGRIELWDVLSVGRMHFEQWQVLRMQTEQRRDQGPASMSWLTVEVHHAFHIRE